VYVSEGGSVRRYYKDTGQLVEPTFIQGTGYHNTKGMAFGPNGNLYVVRAGSGESLVQVFSPDGTGLGNAVGVPDTPTMFGVMFGLADGNMYASIGDPTNLGTGGVIRRYDASGLPTLPTPQVGGDFTLHGTTDLTEGPDAHFYAVVAEGGETERIVRSDGTTGAELDDPWVSVGPGVPTTLAFDLEGNLYVSEGYIGTPKVRKFDADGTDLGILIENNNFGVGAVHIAFYDPGMSAVAGDANGDGVVDVADLGILGANWGASQTASLNILIPEPATVLTLNFGLFCFGRRRRS